MRDIDPERMRHLEATAREIGHIIGKVVDKEKGNGFALMLFSFDGPEFTWISNAQRYDMIQALREFIRKYEAGEASQTFTIRN